MRLLLEVCLIKPHVLVDFDCIFYLWYILLDGGISFFPRVTFSQVVRVAQIQ